MSYKRDKSLYGQRYRATYKLLWLLYVLDATQRYFDRNSIQNYVYRRGDRP